MLIYMYIVVSLEPPSSGNSSLLNARMRTSHGSGHKIAVNHVLLKSSNASDSLQVTPSKDNKISTISQLTGARYNILMLQLSFSFWNYMSGGLAAKNKLSECRIAKLGITSPKSDRVLEKESVQLSGTKGSPVTTSKILKSVPEGKPALPSPVIMQKVPEACSLPVECYVSLNRGSHFYSKTCFLLGLSSLSSAEVCFPFCLEA